MVGPTIEAKKEEDKLNKTWLYYNTGTLIIRIQSKNSVAYIKIIWLISKTNYLKNSINNVHINLISKCIRQNKTGTKKVVNESNKHYSKKYKIMYKSHTSNKQNTDSIIIKYRISKKST